MLAESDSNLDIQHYLSIKYRIKPINTHQTSITNHSSNLKQDQQFFTFVRNRKYKQAFILGQAIIKDRPSNNTVATFCQFLKRNFIQGQQPHQAVQEQQQQQEKSSQACSEDESQSQSQSNSDQISEDSQTEELQPSKSKVNERKKEGSQLMVNKKVENENFLGQKKSIQNPYIPKLALTTTPKIKTRRIENNKQKQNQKKEDKEDKGSGERNEEKKLTSEKDLVKSIINIKLNQQNNYDRERRYKNTTLANNSTKKCVKLPWIKNKLGNMQITNNNKQNEKENEDRIKQNRQKCILRSKQNDSQREEENGVNKKELGIVLEQRQQYKELNESRVKRNSYKLSSNCIRNKLDEKRMSTNSINLKVFENIKKMNMNSSVCVVKNAQGQST